MLSWCDMLWLRMVVVLLVFGCGGAESNHMLHGCANCETARGEYTVTGRLMQVRTFCGTPPLPPTPIAGPIAVYADGARGYAVNGEPLFTTTAADDGTFTFELPAGTYCLSGGNRGLCLRRVVIPDEYQDVDVTYYQSNGGPCDYDEEIDVPALPTMESESKIISKWTRFIQSRFIL